MINVALAGGWHVHAKGYAQDIINHPDCTLVGVWDDDSKRGIGLAEELGCPYVSDYGVLVADSSVDAVIITGATNQHLPLICGAAKAGKHVFTEKVLAITAEEAGEMQTAVKQSGICFTISFPHQSLGAVRAAKRAVEQGRLGQITYLRVRNVHGGSVQNWLPTHFYDKKACGGGAMIDLGAHPMYLIPWFLGMPKTVASAFTSVTGREVEDNAVSVMTYENGAIGVAETGFVSPADPYLIEISGTKGFLRVQNKEAEILTDGSWEVLPGEAGESPMNDWISSILKGVPGRHFGIDEAVRLSVLMEAAYRSWTEGRTVLL
ncbi:MAG: Gfo/Idh/MocA family oxidoreductase [Clostridia bacterium]|nr:Gfo/Idh/MocA family oxidoreductase [Clostridia bacterium]